MREQDVYRGVAEGRISKEEAVDLIKRIIREKSSNRAGGMENTNDYAANVQKKVKVEASHVRSELIKILCRILHLEVAEINEQSNFKELGIDSISGVEIVRDINKCFEINLDAVVLYDYSTISELTKHISEKNVQSANIFSSNAGKSINSPDKSRQMEGEKTGRIVLKKYSFENEAERPVSPGGIKNTKQRTLEFDKVELPDKPKIDVFDSSKVHQKLLDIVAGVLHLSTDEISTNESFKALGVDSINGVEIIGVVNKHFSINLDAVTLYDYPTAAELAACITNELIKVGKLQAVEREKAQVESENKECDSSAANEQDIVKEAVKKKVLEVVSGVLHLAASDINTQTSFREMGIDSICSVEIIRDINQALGLELDTVVLYDYSTITGLTAYIVNKYGRTCKPWANNIKKTQQVEEPKQISKMIKEEPIHKYKSISFDELFPDRPLKNEQNVKIQLKGKENAAQLNKDSQKEDEIEAHSVFAGKNFASEVCTPKEKDDAVAVIGMSGRFPGAENIYEFWQNLKNGVDSITEVPKSRWDIDEYYSADSLEEGKTYCRVGGYINNVDSFDPLFFNISPLEAELMDPQQRVFLEESWKALENAGYSDVALSNMKCGVFVGTVSGDYNRKLMEVGLENSAEAFSGMASSILAARISYFLNLKGPSIAIDTACSSSLMAIHQSCNSILNGECEMALAGGVVLMLTPDLHLKTSRMGMLSPTGKCKTFDNEADGTIFSEGAGVIVLKSLKKAIADRDYIYGVILGSGTNQDGKTNGITAPSALSQKSLELDVYKKAGINPENISYVEAHGTGTSLGDPIEVKALKGAFEEYTNKKQFCAIGSVKTNIGHLTMAAGISGVIKVLLAMKYKKIPPLLNFKKENEHINFKDTPFFVNTDLIDWNTRHEGIPRIAAISAFGFSGTNCHIVVQEYPMNP